MALGLEKERLLLVKAAPTGRINTEVTSVSGWTDLSAIEDCIQTVEMTTGRETTDLQPSGTDVIGEPVATTGSGTLTINLVRRDGNDPDPGKFFEDIRETTSARFQFCYQPDRAALTVNDTTTPAASSANPQYTGSAVITEIDHWGPGGAEVRMMNITASLGSDFRKRQ